MMNSQVTLLLLAALLAACSLTQTVQAANQAVVSPSGEGASGGLAAALADPAIAEVLLEGSDFDVAAELQQAAPLAIERNLTIIGGRGTATFWRQGYSVGLLRLCTTCTLTFSNITVVDETRGAGAQNDAIVGGGGAAAVVMRDAALLRAACLPAGESLVLAQVRPRSAAFPAAPQTHAVRKAELRGRAYPRSVDQLDVALDVPLAADGAAGGYAMHLVRTVRLCRHEVDAACLQASSPDACVAKMVDSLQAAGGDAEEGGVQHPQQQQQRRQLPPAALAAAVVVPVVVAAAALAGLLVLLRVRRAAAAQRREQFSDGKGGEAPSQADAHMSFADCDGSGSDSDGNAKGGNNVSSSNTSSSSGSGSGKKAAAASASTSSGTVVAAAAGPLALPPPAGPAQPGWALTATATSPLLSVEAGDARVTCDALIGRGSYGRVYAGTFAGRPAAVKVIESGADAADAVWREVELMLSLSGSSAHVVRALHAAMYTSCPLARAGTATGALTISRRTSSSGSSSSASSDDEPAGACCGTTNTNTNTTTTMTSLSHAGGGGARCETHLVMELCDLGQLQEVLARWRGALPEGDELMLQRLRLLHGAALGLAALHKQCITHGDVNARNILVAGDAAAPGGCVAKLTDLGLSRALQAGQTHATTNAFGTLSHLAPEILQYGHVGLASDVYALAVTMHEAFTGLAAFKGLQYGQYWQAVVAQQLRPIVPLGMPSDYHLLMERMWCADPARRPSIEQVAECLALMARERERRLGLRARDAGEANVVASMLEALEPERSPPPRAAVDGGRGAAPRPSPFAQQHQQQQQCHAGGDRRLSCPARLEPEADAAAVAAARAARLERASGAWAAVAAPAAGAEAPAVVAAEAVVVPPVFARSSRVSVDVAAFGSQPFAPRVAIDASALWAQARVPASSPAGLSLSPQRLEQVEEALDEAPSSSAPSAQQLPALPEGSAEGSFDAACGDTAAASQAAAAAAAAAAATAEAAARALGALSGPAQPLLRPLRARRPSLHCQQQKDGWSAPLPEHHSGDAYTCFSAAAASSDAGTGSWVAAAAAAAERAQHGPILLSRGSLASGEAAAAAGREEDEAPALSAALSSGRLLMLDDAAATPTSRHLHFFI